MEQPTRLLSLTSLSLISPPNRPIARAQPQRYRSLPTLYIRIYLHTYLTQQVLRTLLAMVPDAAAISGLFGGVRATLHYLLDGFVVVVVLVSSARLGLSVG